MTNKALTDLLKGMEQGLENKMNEATEYHENLFIGKLNEIMIPEISGYSSWPEFKQRIINKEFFLNFYFHTNNLKRIAPETFSKNNQLSGLKTLIIIGLVAAIIYTGTYINFFLLLISFLGRIPMTARKDRRLTMLLIPAFLITAFSYFFYTNWAFPLIAFLSLFLTYLTHENHDKALYFHALKNQFNFLSLFENSIIMKIQNRVSKIDHIKTTKEMKERLNTVVKKYNNEKGTNIKF
jgi:hypothetical protein